MHKLETPNPDAPWEKIARLPQGAVTVFSTKDLYANPYQRKLLDGGKYVLTCGGCKTNFPFLAELWVPDFHVCQACFSRQQFWQKCWWGNWLEWVVVVLPQHSSPASCDSCNQQIDEEECFAPYLIQCTTCNKSGKGVKEHLREPISGAGRSFWPNYMIADWGRMFSHREVLCGVCQEMHLTSLESYLAPGELHIIDNGKGMFICEWCRLSICRQCGTREPNVVPAEDNWQEDDFDCSSCGPCRQWDPHAHIELPSFDDLVEARGSKLHCPGCRNRASLSGAAALPSIPSGRVSVGLRVSNLPQQAIPTHSSISTDDEEVGGRPARSMSDGMTFMHTPPSDAQDVSLRAYVSDSFQGFQDRAKRGDLGFHRPQEYAQPERWTSGECMTEHTAPPSTHSTLPPRSERRSVRNTLHPEDEEHLSAEAARLRMPSDASSVGNASHLGEKRRDVSQQLSRDSSTHSSSRRLLSGRHQDSGHSSDNSANGVMSILGPEGSSQKPTDGTSQKPLSHKTDRSGDHVSIVDIVLPPGFNDWQINYDDIIIEKDENGCNVQLGRGAYGSVYKATIDYVTEVAVKVFHNNQSPMEQADMLREVSILKSCRDKNIVNFVGACFQDDQVLLVTEFMEAGDLWHLLRQSRPPNMWSWYKRGRRVALDVARGLHYLHKRKIIHFDLKSPNILLTQDGSAKISDVGFANIMSKTYLSNAAGFTFAWAAPEVLMGGACTEKVDIFSYGVLLWELVTGEVPQRGRLRDCRVPEECPAAVEDLIQQCLSLQAEERPICRKIVDVLMKLRD